MTNPLEEFFGELLSVKGIFEGIIIVILIFVLFVIIGSLKQTAPENQQLNDTLTSIEENTTEGIKWYFIVGGIIGTITLLFLGYKAVVWLLEQFGNGNSFYPV